MNKQTLKKVLTGTAVSALLAASLTTFPANAANVYDVIVETDGHGTASTLFSDSFTTGSTVYLTCRPNDGYRFVKWNVIQGDANIRSSRFQMPYTGVVVRAEFAEDNDGSIISSPYDINIDTNNDGIPDLNVDTDNNGLADTNLDIDGSGTATINRASAIKGSSGTASWTHSSTGEIYSYPVWNNTAAHSNPTNIQGLGSYSAVTLNFDFDGDQWPDYNIDINGDGTPDSRFQLFNIVVNTSGGGSAGVIGSSRVTAGSRAQLVYRAEDGFTFSDWVPAPAVTITDSEITSMPWSDLYIKATFKNKYDGSEAEPKNSSSSSKSSSSSVKKYDYSYTLKEGQKKKVSRFAYETEDDDVYDVSYSSTGIATLSTDGTIKAKDEGSTIITLTKKNAVYKIKVKVKEKDSSSNKRSSSSRWSRDAYSSQGQVGNSPGFTYIKSQSNTAQTDSKDKKTEESKSSSSTSSSSSSSKSSSSSSEKEEEDNNWFDSHLKDISSLRSKNVKRAGSDDGIEVTYDKPAQSSGNADEAAVTDIPEESYTQPGGVTISGILSQLTGGDMFPYTLMLIPGLILILVALIYVIFIRRRR